MLRAGRARVHVAYPGWTGLASKSGAYYRKIPGKVQQGAENEAFGICSWRTGAWFHRRHPGARRFSVVKFELGYCRIWWNSGATPWGAGWTKIAVAPNFTGAWAAQDAAVKNGLCK